MEEVEILVQVEGSAEGALKKLSTLCTFLKCSETKDCYFFEPQKGRFQLGEHGLDECLRIRIPHNDKAKLTYKKDIFDAKGHWTHSEEEETTIEDPLIMQNILEKLGYKELVEINTKKHKFETSEFHVVLEEVKELGLFLEVEAIKLLGTIEQTREKIKQFLTRTGLTLLPESGMGKPELLLRKKNGTNHAYAT